MSPSKVAGVFCCKGLVEEVSNWNSTTNLYCRLDVISARGSEKIYLTSMEWWFIALRDLHKFGMNQFTQKGFVPNMRMHWDSSFTAGILQVTPSQFLEMKNTINSKTKEGNERKMRKMYLQKPIFLADSRIITTKPCFLKCKFSPSVI